MFHNIVYLDFGHNLNAAHAHPWISLSSAQKAYSFFFRRIMFSALVVRFIFVSVFNFQKQFSIDGILYGIRVIAPYRNYCLYHNFLLVFDLPELSPTSFLLKWQWHAPNQLMQRIATTHSLKIENVFFFSIFSSSICFIQKICTTKQQIGSGSRLQCWNFILTKNIDQN